MKNYLSLCDHMYYLLLNIEVSLRAGYHFKNYNTSTNTNTLNVIYTVQYTNGVLQLICFFLPYFHKSFFHILCIYFYQMPQACRTATLSNIVGQLYIASTWIALIGCEQNYTKAHFFYFLSGYKKYWLQLSFDWRSFSTTWYWVISIDTFDSIPTDTQPLYLLHQRFPVLELPMKKLTNIQFGTTWTTLL